MNTNNFGIIMAGGIGSRFWPMSQSYMPKQFLDVLGIGKTMIQDTFERLSKLIPAHQIFIVTNEKYEEIILNQLPELTASQILKEPARRNTAPCIAYASFKIKKINPNARVVVAPSDHLILREEAFLATLNIALDQAESTGNLITLGIKPSRPETGYGYIQFEDSEEVKNDLVKQVKTFTEKPTLEIAKKFIESGDFYWNSGIFIWTNQSILANLDTHQQEVYSLFAEGENEYGTEREQEFINRIYSISPNISIDYGVMEKAEKVDVVLSDFGWSDLGTWGSLHTHMEKDENNNAVYGKNVRLYETSSSTVRMPEDKTVIIQGLEDYIVVDANNTLLICKHSEEQRIRNFVNDLKLNDKK